MLSALTGSADRAATGVHGRGLINMIEDPRQITPRWLTDVFRAGGHEGTVAHVERQPIGTGMMGQTWRIALRWSSGSGPLSIVVKFEAPGAQSGAVSRGANFGSIETHFYSEVAPTVRVAAPRCWHSTSDAETGAYLLLLQDMAPAVPGDQIAGCTPEQMAAAVRNIAGLHADTWCDPAVPDMSGLSPVGPAVADAVRDLMVTYVPVVIQNLGIEGADAEILKRSAAGAAGWLRSRLERWSLIHTDYRLDNVLFGTDASTPSVIAVDWANLAWGNPLRDVACVVATGLDPAVRARHEGPLIDAYADELHRLGVDPPSAEVLFDDYRLGLFSSPLLVVLGAMAATAPSPRGDDVFRTMVRRSCAAIRELGALELIE